MAKVNEDLLGVKGILIFISLGKVVFFRVCYLLQNEFVSDTHTLWPRKYMHTRCQNLKWLLVKKIGTKIRS